MTTIEKNSGYATLINVFTVEPDRAAELAALLDTATEEVMRQRPGFRTANIHVSTDGTRVVNYAQWDSADAYRAMLADPTTQEHMAAAALAISFDPHLYTVESVHER
jgi:quinol monooxygenase YgiN